MLLTDWTEPIDTLASTLILARGVSAPRTAEARRRRRPCESARVLSLSPLFFFMALYTHSRARGDVFVYVKGSAGRQTRRSHEPERAEE